MAKIDTILGGIIKYDATAAVLKSNAPMMFRFPTGHRYANQKVLHRNLTSLVLEVAGSAEAAALERQRPASFTHAYKDKRFQVTVEPSRAEWTVTIEVKQDDQPPVRPQPIPDPTPSKPATSAASRSDKLMDRLLYRMCDQGSSDLHLCTEAALRLRVHGAMVPFEDVGPFSEAEMMEALKEIMPKRAIEEFEEHSDTDFAYEIKDLSRFRVNVFRDRMGPGVVIRAIPFELLSPEQLGLPKPVLELCSLTKGLVLVTGPTGSGKSTTLATLIDHINTHRDDHIITIEDPIEFVHQNKRCLVNQREVHVHTSSFKDALRAALREDPDIVLVGEMRDLETIAIAVETAETGHLVFGTLHTTTAPSTVDRIIDQFPPDRQMQIRQMVAESLRGVIAQNLCKKKGGGRVAAFEVLIGGPAVSNLIREQKTFQLASVMQTGRKHGMVTLADSLMTLVRSGAVEPDEAYIKAADKESFLRMLKADGIELSRLADARG